MRRYSRIAGTGSYLPPRRVTNDDLVAQLAGQGIETSDEWIVERTGIHARHFAERNVSSSDLALQASLRALEAAGRQAQDIDLIIVATSTPDMVFPSAACILQNKLGANGCPAFDVQAVCSGFIYALTVADAMLKSGAACRALVIGSEVFSRILDFNDRGTCVLFGDGAGAVVLEAFDEPGILATHVAPLQARLAALLEASGHPATEITQRVRLLSMAKRPVELRFFADITIGLLERKRIEIDAWNRERDETNTRIVSPQRLVHYRDNWYLDAWCHLRDGLRSFSVDTIQRVKVLREKARDVASSKLDSHFSSAYGIFGGHAKEWAVLRFSPERARWVQSERWHGEQQSEMLPDGSYRLKVPYADERELLMDILRHGRHVEVEAPQSLRRSVADEVAVLAATYHGCHLISS